MLVTTALNKTESGILISCVISLLPTDLLFHLISTEIKPLYFFLIVTSDFL